VVERLYFFSQVTGGLQEGQNNTPYIKQTTKIKEGN